MEELTIEINGKSFEFERISLKKNFQLRKYFQKMQKSTQKEARYQALLKKLEDKTATPEELELIKQYVLDEMKLSLITYWREVIQWHRFCRMIFKKNFSWKYLLITPKELRCRNITIQDVGRIQANFFHYWTEKPPELNEQLNTFGAIVQEKQAQQ